MPLGRTVLASAALALCTASGADAFSLHVLHFNDFHSRIESIDKYDSTCSQEDEDADACFGGAARLYTAIERLRQDLKDAGENVITLDAGDNFQGSLFFTTYSGEAELEMMNRIGLDAMVVGNHEFDLGIEPLAKFIHGADFPVLFGNVDVSKDETIAPHTQEPLVLTVAGERVGILGAVTTDTPEISSPGPSVSFLDTVGYLTRAAQRLEDEGVDKIIVLSHVGATADVRIAKEVSGIDAIVGGHSHTLFSNDSAEATYPYPLMVDGPDGHAVPVVQAGAYSKYLGHLVLAFDDTGVVTSATGEAILLDASVKPDAGILQRIEEMGAPIAELKARPVAEIAADIDGSSASCRQGECEMGNLVADAMLDRVRGQGVTIAIQNGGGLRASLGAGEVTMGDVLAVLPFQNTLATFNLSGAGIISALENGVSQVEEEGGRFPQVAGLSFTWDPSVPPKQGRIKEVLVRDGDGWAPIDPEKVYSVVTNNFLRGGGDGYSIFEASGKNAYDYGPGVDEVLADYLERRQGYVPSLDGRITARE
jgi:5'-nucleotidase / UDP-sugar diphosphatase